MSMKKNNLEDRSNNDEIFLLYFKKHWKGILITVIFIIPMLINIVFKIPAIIDLFEAEFTAGEFITYYGSVLAFIGTVILGYLALKQTNEIDKKSDENFSYLDNQEKFKNLPLFAIYHTGSSGCLAHLRFNLVNVSDNVASNIKLSGFKIEHNGEVQEVQPPTVSKNYLLPRGELAVEYYNKAINIPNITFSIEIYCRDKLNNNLAYCLNIPIGNDPEDIGKFNESYVIDLKK